MSVNLMPDEEKNNHQVQAMIAELNQDIASLELDIKELSHRLMPVTRSEVKQTEEEKDPQPNLVPIALDIYKLRTRVDGLIGQVRDLLQILEI